MSDISNGENGDISIGDLQATHRVIDVMEHRLVIADDEQLQHRQKLELVLPHEAGAHLVTARKLLDARLRPGPSLLRFTCRYGASPPQGGDLGRVPVVF